ncbi:MAG TPA: extracellular solute-binding protein [Beijerinckiaceae bacterium]|nr:extracellular solute-binding protein [Beijerinckiaceae bacterium]
MPHLEVRRRHAGRAILTAAAASLAGLLAIVPASGQSGQELLTYTGADRQQKLLECAKKEGEVVIYSAMIANQALRPITSGFMKKYPVKMTYWRGDSEDIAAKLAAEVRANNVVADVVEGTGVGEAVVEANLVQRYYTPVLSEFPEKYRDPEGYWTPTRLSYFGIAYNTRLVPADKVPKSYEDLLDPQWKGKIAWRIGSSSGTPLFLTNLRLAWGEEKARAYLRKLAEQKVVNFGSGSARTLVDRVIAGEYAIALNIFAHHPLISKAKGAPVEGLVLEPVPTTTATMLIPKGARHPCSALLLVDYILSKDGQTILAGAEYFPARPDVPPDPSVAKIVPSVAGVAEHFVNPPTLHKNYPVSEAIFQEMFR